MALPQKVVEQIGRETPPTQGWSLGIIAFSGAILFIMLFVWAGLTFGYKPYLDDQSSKIEDQINTLNQSISPTDQANLINFYSQLSNLSTLLSNHIAIQNVFSWLSANTEANVYYSSFTFGQGEQLSLSVNAKTEADANQQIAIFETSPDVQNLTISGISAPSGGIGFWQFSATMNLSPSVFANNLSTEGTAPATTPTTPATTTQASGATTTTNVP